MTTGPNDPQYQYVDRVDIPGAVRFLVADIAGTQGEMTAAYLGIDRVALIQALATLIHALWIQTTGSADGLREWLEAVALADRQLPESGVDL